MKINNVIVDNWKPPGTPFWDKARAKPDEPLLQVTVQMTLSLNEYHTLLNQDERHAILAEGKRVAQLAVDKLRNIQA